MLTYTGTVIKYRRLGYALWPEPHVRTQQIRSKYRRLGYALWPEQVADCIASPLEYRRLGYALWPEPALATGILDLKYRRLGYALWPEHNTDPRRSELEYRRLGYALWPELEPLIPVTGRECRRLGYASYWFCCLMDGVQFVHSVASFDNIRLFAVIARQDNSTHFRDSGEGRPSEHACDTDAAKILAELRA